MRQGRIEYIYHPCETEVDAGCDERRRNGKRDKIDQEAVEVEDVIAEHYAADVPDDFTEEAERHPGHEGPGLVANAEEEMGDDQNAENGGIDGVAGEGGDVVHLALG